jgi:hypothetical protein
MKSLDFLTTIVNLGSPLNAPQVRDFKLEIFLKSPRVGNWGAEAVDTEAKELHQIHVKIIQTI